jgi:hypothetical protein
VLVAVTVLAAACGGSGGSSSEGSGSNGETSFNADDWSAEALAVDPEAVVAPVMVNSSVAVGKSRLVFALLGRDGVPVSDAKASVRLFALETEPNSDAVRDGVLIAEQSLDERAVRPSTDHIHADGAIHAHTSGRTSVYVTTVPLDQPGDWGAEVRAIVDGNETTSRVKFFVLEQSREPGIGEAAPRSEQPVLRDVADVAEIDTATPPNPSFHELTVAEAIDRGKPIVVAFVTPAFCQTRFCGPVLDLAVAPMAEQFGDQITIVHIEPFDIAAIRSGELIAVPELAEWGLVTEPWVFVVDGSGNIAAKFEGIVEAEEIAAALAPLVGDGT